MRQTQYQPADMISDRQVVRLTDLAIELQETDDLTQLLSCSSDAITEMVPCDAPIVELLVNAQRSLRSSPISAQLERFSQPFFEHREEDPVYARRLRLRLDGAQSVHMLAGSEFDQTALYREAFRPLRIRRYLGSRNIGAFGLEVAATRSDGADFSDSDATMISQISRLTDAAIDRLARQHSHHVPVGDGTAAAIQRFTWLVCDADGRVLRSTPAAARSLRDCLGADASIKQLPPSWRARLRQRLSGRPIEPLRYDVNGGCVRVFPAPIRCVPGECSIFFVTEAADDSPIGAFQKLGLTLREAEVLWWASEGKTNPEIAIILGMSAGTAKKHMQHIFEKLKVETRTAAIRHAFRMTSQ